MSTNPGEEVSVRSKGDIEADIERYRRLLAQVEAELVETYGDPAHDDPSSTS